MANYDRWASKEERVFTKGETPENQPPSQIELQDSGSKAANDQIEIPEEQIFLSHYYDELGDLEATKAGSHI